MDNISSVLNLSTLFTASQVKESSTQKESNPTVNPKVESKDTFVPVKSPEDALSAEIIGCYEKLLGEVFSGDRKNASETTEQLQQLHKEYLRTTGAKFKLPVKFVSKLEGMLSKANEHLISMQDQFILKFHEMDQETKERFNEAIGNLTFINLTIKDILGHDDPGKIYPPEVVERRRRGIDELRQRIEGLEAANLRIRPELVRELDMLKSRLLLLESFTPSESTSREDK